MYFWGCFNDEWQRVRDFCLNSLREDEKTLIENWCTLIGYDEPVGYSVNMAERTLDIYVRRIGKIVGHSGTNIEILKKLLEEHYGRPYKVKLHEVYGGFVNLEKKENEEE